MLTKQFGLFFFQCFFAAFHLPLDFFLFPPYFPFSPKHLLPSPLFPGLPWQDVSLSRREASPSHLYNFTTTHFSGQYFHLPHISLCSDSLARA